MEFGDGSELDDLDLPPNSAVQSFVEDERKLSREICAQCRECKLEIVVEGVCSTCRNDKSDPVPKLSAKNLVHPSMLSL